MRCGARARGDGAFVSVCETKAPRRASGPARSRIGENRRIANLDHVRSYYDALNSGDVELVASHFTDDAVHYYTRLGPHEGAERIGQNAKLGVGAIDGQGFIEHGIEQSDEAVIE